MILDPKLHMRAQGAREIVRTRDFAAPRALVFEAFTKPELLRQWLGVFDGWKLDVCEIDLRVDGTYRWVWRNAKRATAMGAGGVYREIVPNERIVATERYDDAWYPGDAIVTTAFAERSFGTALTMTLLYESKEVRDGVLASPAESGVAAGFDVLAELLRTLK
ncbi:MAG: SRPBCC family protein [Archangium sp.]|nr:SRPBCC family protein [Archangium sp.]